MPEFCQEQPKPSFHGFNLVILTKLNLKTYFNKKELLELNKQIKEPVFTDAESLFKGWILTLNITGNLFPNLFHWFIPYKAKHPLQGVGR